MKNLYMVFPLLVVFVVCVFLLTKNKEVKEGYYDVDRIDDVVRERISVVDINLSNKLQSQGSEGSILLNRTKDVVLECAQQKIFVYEDLFSGARASNNMRLFMREKMMREDFVTLSDVDNFVLQKISDCTNEIAMNLMHKTELYLYDYDLIRTFLWSLNSLGLIKYDKTIIEGKRLESPSECLRSVLSSYLNNAVERYKFDEFNLSGGMSLGPLFQVESGFSWSKEERSRINPCEM